jgi:23S rRNA pseudouridine1911/1915/1917 synthase
MAISDMAGHESRMSDDDYDDADVASGSPLSPVVLRIPDDAVGNRLDKVLSGLMPQFSRSRIQQWMEEGAVVIDGRAATLREIVLGDEEVVVRPQASAEENAYQPEALDLSVVFEDKDIVVIDKPAGMVVHPAAGNWSGTLLNGLLHHYPSIGGVPRAGIVHRLDKETSGLMVVAKTNEAHVSLIRQLQARTVKREYLALVWGNPPSHGTVDAPMARHPRDRVKMAVSTSNLAKPAVTHYERVAIGTIDAKTVTLLRCTLETGRTHQIRVHMQSLGFALVGDPLYGKAHLANIFPRQALHARRLGLMHPRSGKTCEWEAPLPVDMLDLLERAGIAPSSL